MLYQITAGIAAALIILLIVIATRPASFRYTRSLTIAAPAELLFQQANDLHKFQKWNPWASVDPSLAITYAGPPSGVGSSYTWSGNREVGEGTMTIVENRPGELVRARMDFRKPFAATNTVDFIFIPEGNDTVVSWSMYGPNNFMGKAMGMVMNIDKMCGDQFTKGLQKLKALAESAAPGSPQA